MELLVNVRKWIEENKTAFLPPVCNKLMHRHQLNVMFVGGPNERKDYHIEEGEELFYQVKGDMCLKIIENGKKKDIVIREGEMFLLPTRIPHSPQRYVNTVGLVIERERLKTEIDGLRYYVGESTNVLFEKWFHFFVNLRNMNKTFYWCLNVYYSRFFNSRQYQTGKPNPDELLKETPFPLNSTSVMEPFSFQGWLNDHRGEIKQKKSLSMFGDHFETEVIAYGPGTTEKSKKNSDIWIWQLEGTSTVTTDGKTLTLSAGDSLLVRAQSTYCWERTEECVALCIAQDPKRKQPYT
ncbi:3HAO dioxygenase, partial [Steatornis caripensis]|nr:3HAO dioxygenase [Steatornis caripensis]